MFIVEVHRVGGLGSRAVLCIWNVLPVISMCT